MVQPFLLDTEAIMDETTLSPGNRRLPLHSTRPTSPGKTLCIPCETVIDRIICPQPDTSSPSASSPSSDTRTYTTPTTIGWLDRLIATKFCVICRFASHLFFSGSAGFTTSEITNGRRFLCFIPGGLVQLNSSGVRLEWDILVHTQEERESGWRVGVEWKQKGSPGFKLLHDSVPRIVEDCGIGEGEVVRKVGRRLGEMCSRAFIRDSYRICREKHGSKCDRPKTLLVHEDVAMDIRISALRVVDVLENRLTTLPTESEYIILSYCWSTTKAYTTLVLSNQQALSQPDGIKKEQIAPTIADAMQVTAILGHRYLWVDSLCIIQDSTTDKQSQINKMDNIYLHASLTIIGAASLPDGTDTGLPGIRPAARSVSQGNMTARGLEFVEATPDLWGQIWDSRWGARAWTMQEHLLSKRELLFTPVQAYFSCACDAFAEDYVEEMCVHHKSDSTTSPFSTSSFGGRAVEEDKGRECCAYRTPQNMDNRGVPQADNFITSYEVLVREYTKRNLTFESDVLRAAGGVLSILHQETRVHFLCGLPVPHLLDRFIFWIPLTYCRRRGVGTSGMLFPSWSWAGWVGAITYPVSPEQFSGKKMVFSDESLVAGFVAWAGHSDGTTIEIRLPEVSQTALSMFETVFLVFEAQTARLSVSKLCWGSIIDQDLSYRYRVRAVFVQEACAGMVCLDEDVPPDHGDGVGLTQDEAWDAHAGRVEEMDFVALSKTGMPWDMVYLIHPDVNNTVNYGVEDSEGNYKSHSVFDPAIWDNDEPSAINVLVVEWQGDKAFRKGVGQIHSQAWDLVKTAHKKIRLG